MSSASQFVTLISAEGHRFVIPREAAMGSPFLKDSLQGEFAEALTGEVSLPDQRAEIVEKVAEYLVFQSLYTEDDRVDFGERCKPELALELLSAADYLGC